MRAHERSKERDMKSEKKENIEEFNFESVAKNYYTDEQYEKIVKTRIGIAGAGGLGSNCAMQLVRCGFSGFHYRRF